MKERSTVREWKNLFGTSGLIPHACIFKNFYTYLINFMINLNVDYSITFQNKQLSVKPMIVLQVTEIQSPMPISCCYNFVICQFTLKLSISFNFIYKTNYFNWNYNRLYICDVNLFYGFI